MIKNVNNLDRGARVGIAAAALIVAFVVGVGTWVGVLLVVVAVILAATAVVGFCPIYRIFGLSTRPAPTGSAPSEA